MKIYITQFTRYDDDYKNRSDDETTTKMYTDLEELKNDVIEDFIDYLADNGDEPNEDELKKIENVKNNNENLDDINELYEGKRFEGSFIPRICEFVAYSQVFNFINEDNLEEVKSFVNFVS